MRIVGGGFLAQHFGRLSSAEAPCVFFGSGVSDSRLDDPRAFKREEELLCEELLGCRERGETLIYPSSAGTVSGLYSAVVREDSQPVPTLPYGLHKRRLEDFIRNSGASFLILRFANLAGAGQRRHQLVSSLTEQILAGHVEVWRGAHRDLLDVGDAVGLVDALLASGTRDQVINVASGESVEVESIVNYLAAQLGEEPSRTNLDRGDHYSVSIERLRRLLPEDPILATFDGTYFRTVLDRHLASHRRSLERRLI